MSESGAEAVRTEGGGGAASEETALHRQRGRAAFGSTEPGAPGRLQPSQPAGLPCRPAVRLSFSLKENSGIFQPA